MCRLHLPKNHLSTKTKNPLKSTTFTPSSPNSSTIQPSPSSKPKPVTPSSSTTSNPSNKSCSKSKNSPSSNSSNTTNYSTSPILYKNINPYPIKTMPFTKMTLPILSILLSKVSFRCSRTPPNPLSLKISPSRKSKNPGSPVPSISFFKIKKVPTKLKKSSSTKKNSPKSKEAQASVLAKFNSF